jgi:N-acetylmuramoyl-L-alanine amidase
MDLAKVGSAVPEISSSTGKLAVLPKVTGIRHWSTPMGSTVVIDMQDQAPYEVHRLMSPERIYFDLHDTALSAGLDGKTIDIGDTSLTRVRVAQPVSGVTRIVLDTRDGSNFSVSMESNPNRMVSSFAPTIGHWQRIGRVSTSKAPQQRWHPSARDQRRSTAGEDWPVRIALDAGHGGWDMGTVGRKGLLEGPVLM